MVDARPWQMELDELDRAISEASGELAPAGIPWRLDPALAETVRTVADAHRGPSPSPEFATRLASHLGVPALPKSSGMFRRGSGPRTLFAVRTGPQLPSLPFPIGRAISYLSLAAMLLVMLGGLLLTARYPGGDQAAGPADITASVSGGFPSVSSYWGALLVRRITLAPGAGFNDIGFRMAFVIVETGSINFRRSAYEPVQVLGPGETAATPHGVAIVQNLDPDRPATLLDVGFYTQDSITGMNSRYPGVTFQLVASNPMALNLTGNETATLHRVRLGAGNRAQPWRTTQTSWIVVPQGHLALTLTGDDLPLPFTDGKERIAPDWTTALQPDVGVAVRNPGDTPAVFFVVSIDSPASSTPTT